MGYWGYNAWENDNAADWFADMFEATDLHAFVEDTLSRSVDNNIEETRAAAHIVIALGHTYIWPIDYIDKHLHLAASKLKSLLDSGIFEDSPEIQAQLRKEISIITERLSANEI
jgi:hypothetical protein